MTPREHALQLLDNDPFSQWMGIDLVDADEGRCRVACTVRDEMTNGYHVAHGGILFSLADTALAFAAATLGKPALAIDHSISFLKKCEPGDRLTASATCVSSTRKTGVFSVDVTNQHGEKVAFMKGTVYRTGSS
ncbi:MAG: PaaI family thioesterase [Balneolaceae bacterium]